MRLPTFAALLALGIPAARAQPPLPPATPEARPAEQRSVAAMTTDMATRVFTEVCIGKIGSDPARQAWLREHGFVMVPGTAAAPHLTAGPGTVWLRQDPPSVSFPIAVVSRATGLECEVRSPLADPERAAAVFTATIEALARPGMVIRKDADQNTGPGGGPGRFLLYRVGAAPIEQGGFNLAMSARPPVQGGVALLMTASRAQRE